MNFQEIVLFVFICTTLLTLAASQHHRNGTYWRTGTYRRQIGFNDTPTESNSTTDHPIATTSAERKLVAIEHLSRSNAAKLEVVLQVLAETQRSLLFIERKLREHDEANSIVTLELKEKILILESKLQNGGSGGSRISGAPADEPHSSTQGPMAFDDPPFTRRRYTAAHLTARTVQAVVEDVPIPENSTEASQESEFTTEKEEIEVSTTKAPKKIKVKKIKSPKTGRPDVPQAASQINNVSLVTLDLLMRHPRARLYTEEDFHGEFMDYHSDYSAERGCANLEAFADRIKSVDSYLTCVRVFLEADCQGWSQAIYDGGNQPKSQVLNSKLTTIRSIGRCVQDEFTNAEATVMSINPGVFKDVVSKEKAQHLKLFYIPDLIEFRSDDKSHKSIRVRDSSNLVTNYLRGTGGRLEFAESMITKANLRSMEDVLGLLGGAGGSSSSESSSESEEDGDTLGFALPLNLGGSVDEKYNLFPQSRTSMNEWNEKLKWIPGFFEKYPEGWVSISVNFVYDNDTATRPIAFAYYIDKFNRQIYYGYLEN